MLGILAAAMLWAATGHPQEDPAPADPFELVQLLAGKDAEHVEMRLGESHVTSLLALEAGLNDPNWRIRYRCAEVLGKVADPDSCPALLHALKDSDHRVRAEVAFALSYTGFKPAGRALLPLLADPDAKVREMATMGIGSVGESALFLEAVQNSNPIVRASAADGLRYLKDPDHWLIKLSSDPEPSVRASAVRYFVSNSVQVQSAILARSSDPDPRVRVQVARKLYQLDRTKRPRVITKLLLDGSNEVRVAALDGLSRDYYDRPKLSPDLNSAILRCAKDVDPKVCAGGLRAAASFRALSCADVVATKTSAPNLLVRLNANYARWALSRKSIEKSEAESRVIACLTEGAKQDDQLAAIDILIQIKTPAAIDALCRSMLHDKEPYVRSYSAFALYNIGDARAAGPLMQALKDTDGETLRGASAGLASMKVPGVLEALIEATKNPDAYHREWAAMSLGEFDAAAATPRLIELLSDESDIVRQQAAEFFTMHPNHDAIKPLQRVVEQDWSRFVRQTAKTSLAACMQGKPKFPGSG